MKYGNFFLLVLMGFTLFACSRFDYHQRGIHQSERNQILKSNASVYMVRKGDTLYSIGRKHHVDFHVLAKRNAIKKPYTIFVGQRMFIKGTAPKGQHQSSIHTVVQVPKKVSRSGKGAQQTASHGRIQLVWPAKGRLSSRFGMRNNRMHDGIDIAAKEGVAVVAAASGKVVYSDSRLSGFGNLIIVRHSADMFTAYAHNQKNLVKLGEKVRQGQHIANLGSTGRTTGPNLHFEVRRGKTAVDPLAYLPKL